jgi:pimeloyl-ACP methyl ester carboxylesterase
VQAALGDDDVPCREDGEARVASHLGAQLDAARVNALLVAVELRVDEPTGEVGALAMPGGLRALLRELFDEHLTAALGEGCPLEVDALDRVVVVAHSGGYQAAATVAARGDVPAMRELVLLDALYGGDDVFARWAEPSFDAPRRRFVDLYTCCGGTLERSRALAGVAAGRATFDDDGDSELSPAALASPVVFKRVPRPHAELPAAYLGAILEASGFAPLAP